MMDKEQVEVVKMVYNRFITSEEEIWTDLDENLEMMDYLSDEELIRESMVKIHKHSKGVFRCSQEHEQDHCLAPYILEAAEAIVKLYKETKLLHDKNRYILLYYQAMSEMKMIYAN